MKNFYIFFFLFTGVLSAQTVWDSGSLTFTKANGANPVLPANQDQITANVAITRGNNQGLYNAATETFYTDFLSPADTEWALGSASNFANLTFQDWESTAPNSSPPDYVGQPAVLHLITDDIYIDIIFNSWAVGRQGGMGGFSYTRATGPTASVDDVSPELSFFPNPATTHIQLGSQWAEKPYQLIAATGRLVVDAIVPRDSRIMLEQLTAGIYFLRVENATKKLIIK